MIPRKIPTRDFPAEYAKRAEGRLDPAVLRPGFVAPTHPEPEQAVKEAPSAVLPLPEKLQEENAESLAREPATPAKPIKGDEA